MVGAMLIPGKKFARPAFEDVDLYRGEISLYLCAAAYFATQPENGLIDCELAARSLNHVYNGDRTAPMKAANVHDELVFLKGNIERKESASFKKRKTSGESQGQNKESKRSRTVIDLDPGSDLRPVAPVPKTRARLELELQEIDVKKRFDLEQTEIKKKIELGQIEKQAELKKIEIKKKIELGQIEKQAELKKIEIKKQILDLEDLEGHED